MGAADLHRQQARANLAVAQLLLTHDDAAPNPAAVQWAVTAAFYCAVQCMESHFARFNQHPRSHADRYDLMSQAGVPDEVYDAYEQLHTWSNNGRYYLRAFTRSFVDREVLPRLARVTNFVSL